MPDLDTVFAALRAEGELLTPERVSASVQRAETAIAGAPPPAIYQVRRQGALLAACAAIAVLAGAGVGLLERDAGASAHLMSAESLSIAALLKGG